MLHDGSAERRGSYRGVFLETGRREWKRISELQLIFYICSRDDGDVKFDRFFASVRKADRDFNIGPPASPYAVMRRAYPYRGENRPGKVVESLTPRPGIREHNRREADLKWLFDCRIGHHLNYEDQWPFQFVLQLGKKSTRPLGVISRRPHKGST